MKKRIIEYYEYTVPFYRWFWHGSTGAVHYGLADNSTHGLKDELLNTNRVVARIARVRDGDRILDAGCGVGGSCIWLRSTYDVSVIGITLSRSQVEKARAVAKKRGMDAISFAVKEYTRTGYPSASFDVVWAIESVCHAEDKGAFLKEAFRLLRKGGRLVVADGFLSDAKHTRDERVDAFCAGLALPHLATVSGFAEGMRAAGFKGVRFHDKTRNALPSSKRLHKMCSWGYHVARLTESLHLTPPLLTANNKAGIVQLPLVEEGVLKYGIFVGQK